MRTCTGYDACISTTAFAYINLVLCTIIKNRFKFVVCKWRVSTSLTQCRFYYTKKKVKLSYFIASLPFTVIIYANWSGPGKFVYFTIFVIANQDVLHGLQIKTTCQEIQVRPDISLTVRKKRGTPRYWSTCNMLACCAVCWSCGSIQGSSEI